MIIRASTYCEQSELNRIKWLRRREWNRFVYQNDEIILYFIAARRELRLTSFFSRSILWWCGGCGIVQQTDRQAWVYRIAKINSADCREIHYTCVHPFASSTRRFFLSSCVLVGDCENVGAIAKVPTTKIPILFIWKFTCCSTKRRRALKTATQQNRFTSNSDKVRDSVRKMIFFSPFRSLNSSLLSCSVQPFTLEILLLFRFFFSFFFSFGSISFRRVCLPRLQFILFSQTTKVKINDEMSRRKD